MHPFIRGHEDILLLVPLDSLRKGDIVLAHIDGKRYVIHRIIGVNEDKITLMGDGNLYETEECNRIDIYGKVESIIREGKEHKILSAYAILKAKVWRNLLPIRRVKTKISNLIKRQ